MQDPYNMSIHINTATAQVLVEQRKKNGVISRKNISSQSLSECFLTSRVDDERHGTGLLPEDCITVVMEKKFTYYFIRCPELHADFRYFDTEYRNFPIPRLVCEVDPAAPYWLSPAVSAEPPPEPDLHVSAYPAPSAITVTVLEQV